MASGPEGFMSLLLPVLLACSASRSPVAPPTEPTEASSLTPHPAASDPAPTVWDPPTRLPAPIRELVPPCVELADDSTWCWGYRARSAALTPVDTAAPESTVASTDPSGVPEPEWFEGLEVQALGSFVCGLASDGRVRCARRHGNDERDAAPLAPSTNGWIDGITDAEGLVVGTDWACVRHATGRASCFGHLFGHSGPRLVDALPRTHLDGWLPPTDLGFDDVTAIARTSWSELCVARGDEVTCSGGRDLEVAPVPGLPPVEQAWAMAPTGCARTAGGALWCWSDDTPEPERIADDVVALGDDGLVLDRAGRLGQVTRGRALWSAQVPWPDPPPDLELRGTLDGGCAFPPGGPARCWGSLTGVELPEALTALTVDPLCWLDATGRPGCAGPALTVRDGSELPTLPDGGFVALSTGFGGVRLATPDQLWECAGDTGACRGERWEGAPITDARSQGVIAGGQAMLSEDHVYALPPLDGIGRGVALLDRTGGVHLLGANRARYGAPLRWTTLAVDGGAPGTGWRPPPPSRAAEELPPSPSSPPETEPDGPPLPAHFVRVDRYCAFTEADEAWCRGQAVGRSDLTRLPAFDGARAVLRTEVDCALVDGRLTCIDTVLDGDVPALVDLDGGTALTADGRVLELGWASPGHHALVETDLVAPGAVEVARIEDGRPTRVAVRTADGEVRVLGGGGFGRLSGATAIAAGKDRVYAMDDSGAVHVLRSNRPPEPVPGVSDADAIVASGPFGCARTTNGRVQCFGDLYDHLEPRLPGLPPRRWLAEESPAVDLGLDGVRALSVPAGPGLVVLTEDGIRSSRPGDLGDVTIPVPIRGVPPLRTAGVALWGADGCGLADDGEVWCWFRGRDPVPVGHRAAALTATHEPLWLSDDGDVLAAADGRVGIVARDVWPSPPSGVVIRGRPEGGCAFVPGAAPRCWGRPTVPTDAIADGLLELWGPCWHTTDHRLQCLLDDENVAHTAMTFRDEDGAPLPAPSRIDAIGPGIALPTLRVGRRVFAWDNDSAYQRRPEVGSGAVQQAHGHHVLLEDGTLYDDERVVLENVARLSPSEGLAAHLEDGTVYAVTSGVWDGKHRWIPW